VALGLTRLRGGLGGAGLARDDQRAATTAGAMTAGQLLIRYLHGDDHPADRRPVSAASTS
jgi:hypothetical protein